MRTVMKRFQAMLVLILMLSALMVPAFAAESGAVSSDGVVETAQVEKDTSTGLKALSAAVVVGLAAACGAIGMGMAISKSVEGIARQPEAEGKIRTSLMLGLVFVETVVIYALIVAILIIFVL